MSTDYTAKIMVGVPVSLVEERKTSTLIKKFDEDTGKPYDKETVNDEGLFFGTTELNEICELEFKHRFDMGEVGEYDEGNIVGLTVVNTGSLCYGGGIWNLTENLKNVEEVFETMRKMLKEHNVDEEPKLYLVAGA
mgnify:CR=1 FL=1